MVAFSHFALDEVANDQLAIEGVVEDGGEQDSATELTIYPKPSLGGMFFVKHNFDPETKLNVAVAVYGSQCGLIRYSKITNGLDLTHLSSGVYIVHFLDLNLRSRLVVLY